MSEIKFWQVDAFTNKIFGGNPAATFVLDKPMEDELMQKIAIEMNLSETAFVLMREGQNPLLRWFTPVYEIDLCGHATLASAHILFNELGIFHEEITFDTKFVGELIVRRSGNKITMSFPSRAGDKVEISDIPDSVLKALSDQKPIEAYKSRDLMLVYDNPEVILQMDPDFGSLLRFESEIVVTSKSHDTKYDFISRFFAAADAIQEDPVTGSAHCTLVPYWSKIYGKSKLMAYQASKRGGELEIEVKADQIEISGEALVVFTGSMRL